MSFIDSFRHEHYGNTSTVPIYLPQQEITGEFDAPANSVLLGGGSGELDAWVLLPEEMLFQLTYYYLNDKKANELLPEALDYGITEDQYCDFMERVYDLVEKTSPTWTGDEWFHIVTDARANGYTAKEYGSVERWLVLQTSKSMRNQLVKRCSPPLNETELNIVTATFGMIDTIES